MFSEYSSSSRSWLPLRRGAGLGIAGFPFVTQLGMSSLLPILQDTILFWRL